MDVSCETEGSTRPAAPVVRAAVDLPAWLGSSAWLVFAASAGSDLQLQVLARETTAEVAW